MTSTKRTTIPTRVSQYLAATALAAGIAFGATPIASALPEWDIGAFDQCMAGLDPAVKDGTLSQGEILQWQIKCCRTSGGNWDSIGAKCTAPPAIQPNPGGVTPVTPGGAGITTDPAPPPRNQPPRGGVTAPA